MAAMRRHAKFSDNRSVHSLRKYGDISIFQNGALSAMLYLFCEEHLVVLNHFAKFGWNR